MRALASAAPDWARVLSIAHWHGIVPLLRTALVECGAADIPIQAERTISAEFLRQTADNILYARELARVMDRLQVNGVRCLAFKGPALAMLAYGTTSLRRCRDLDILTAEQDVPKAIDVVRREGYEVDSTDSLEARLLSPDEKDLLLVHRTRSFKIELHWAVAGRSFHIRTPFDEIWQRRQYISVFETRVAAPGPEDLLLLLSIHGTRHCWASLKWICDIAQLVTKYPGLDWRELFRRAAELGCLRMVLVGLTLARRSLGTNLPVSIERQVAADRTVERLSADLYARLFRSTETWFEFERVWCYARSHDRWYDRARTVAAYVRANLRPDARDREFVSLPAYLTALYWPLRPIRVLHKHWRDAAKPLLASLLQ